jgi:Tfp pilus assembly protein PilN
MRPVNLIPPEERRGERVPLRTGSVSYLILAGLAVAVAGVSALVLTGNSINDRKGEIAELEARETAARAQAERLRGFAEFASLSESRAQTVSSLAQSRFDWERVLRELALVIPDDVWLVQLSGAASPDVQLADAAQVSAGSNLTGPALSMVGCATSHEAVARFLQALKDIDGVTRVGIGKSELPEDDTGLAAGSEDDCRTRDFITRFEIVAAFDEVVVPALAPAPVAPAPQAEATPAADDGSGVPETQSQQQEAVGSAAEQTNEAQQAADLVPGVAR